MKRETLTSVHELKHLSPIEVFLRLPKDLPMVTALLSDDASNSRWSILCWNPSQIISSHEPSFKNTFTEILNSRKKTYQGDLPFIGGAIGSIDYEYHICFSFFDEALIYDHTQKKWWWISQKRKKLEFLKEFLKSKKTSEAPELKLQPSWAFPQYQKAFDRIKKNIERGEIYQACLTFPFFGPRVEDTRALFFHLFRKNPSPMAAYLEEKARTILSFSPERFFTWNGSLIETMPIKGTRPRGNTPEEDERLRLELLSDEKEQAELHMITDLLRNDLARVSEPGTVEVKEHHGVQACPTVWHTYSHIQSVPKPNTGPWDIIEAMFPGGSISGCPKKRAVEILAEVEEHPRGIYTGCIGYISDHGRCDFSIAIRTLEQNQTRIQAGFGSGIVYDSSAKKEYDECFAKAKNFLS